MAKRAAKQPVQRGGAKSLVVQGPLTPAYEAILTPDALEFLAALMARFGARREELLADRVRRQAEFDAGVLPDFLLETRKIRENDWRVAPIPVDLQDRRVEITGPVDRKMIINALNSGASTFMADFEDSSTPAWDVMLDGQINLHDAVRGTINYRSPEGKDYRLEGRSATLLVRPRGWHLPEKHILFEGKPIAGSLMDFGLYFFHNVRALKDKGTAPYFYLPKLQNHREARLWNEVFIFAQEAMGVAQGTIRATVLIETITAAFEMDEILYELRDHAGGLNCGRWDYIFSFIKTFRNRPDFVLPERGQVTMTTHFLRSYSRLLIKTCHRRGIHAIGGMAAQIPNKNDPEANRATMDKVKADKEREAGDGHDGTWVGHPGLVALAKGVFDQHMPQSNQIDRRLDELTVDGSDLLRIPEGTITPAGLRANIAVSLHYMESWLRGQGCVPLHNLMEDAATAEISRVQIWQWIKHAKGVLDDGTKITYALFKSILNEELAAARRDVARDDRFGDAAALLAQLIGADQLPDFLTSAAYELLP